MAKEKVKTKEVTAKQIEVIEPIEIVISEKEQVKIELKKVQDKLNEGYDIKNRTSLLRSQQELQIKLKSL